VSKADRKLGVFNDEACESVDASGGGQTERAGAG
jgi:hypothetical protein